MLQHILMYNKMINHLAWTHLSHLMVGTTKKLITADLEKTFSWLMQKSINKTAFSQGFSIVIMLGQRRK